MQRQQMLYNIRTEFSQGFKPLFIELAMLNKILPKYIPMTVKTAAEAPLSCENGSTRPVSNAPRGTPTYIQNDQRQQSFK